MVWAGFGRLVMYIRSVAMPSVIQARSNHLAAGLVSPWFHSELIVPMV